MSCPNLACLQKSPLKIRRVSFQRAYPRVEKLSERIQNSALHSRSLFSRRRPTDEAHKSYRFSTGPSERNSYWGGLKLQASEASKNGGPGAYPRENFSGPRPLDRWKTLHFGKCAIDGNKGSRLMRVFP